MKKPVNYPSKSIQILIGVGLGCLSLVLLSQFVLGQFVLGQFVPALSPKPTSALISDSSVYSYRRPSSDGIGKVYMGREIAEVMGHQGAAWLERNDRLTEEQPQKLIDALTLSSTDAVAEIGAGTGYISFQIAPRVPKGQVIAVDIQPEMIEILKTRAQSKRITNVNPILSTEQNPNLPPNSIDLAIMVDAYHEFNYPREMMSAIAKALKPQGRVALVEYRAEDPRVFIKPLHKMSQAQVRREMAVVGLTWKETQSVLPQQHLMIFSR
jgi:ubiquinone/menaquinone biosynthesis C-methylase UbiE